MFYRHRCLVRISDSERSLIDSHSHKKCVYSADCFRIAAGYKTRSFTFFFTNSSNKPDMVIISTHPIILDKHYSPPPSLEKASSIALINNGGNCPELEYAQKLFLLKQECDPRYTCNPRYLDDICISVDQRALILY